VLPWGFPGGHYSFAGAGALLVNAAGGAKLFLNVGLNESGANTHTGLSGSDEINQDLVLTLDNDMTSGGEDWTVQFDYVLLPPTILP
jgi:hypothetical protein